MEWMTRLSLLTLKITTETELQTTWIQTLTTTEYLMSKKVETVTLTRMMTEGQILQMKGSQILITTEWTTILRVLTLQTLTLTETLTITTQTLTMTVYSMLKRVETVTQTLTRTVLSTLTILGSLTQIMMEWMTTLRIQQLQIMTATRFLTIQILTLITTVFQMLQKVETVTQIRTATVRLMWVMQDLLMKTATVWTMTLSLLQ